MTRRDSYRSPDEWYELVRRVRERAKNCCEGCGLKHTPTIRFETHHIVPLSRGGRTVMSNLLWLCETCHQRRHRHRLQGNSTFGPRTPPQGGSSVSQRIQALRSQRGRRR